MVPLEDLVEDDPVDEAAEADSEQDPRRARPPLGGGGRLAPARGGNRHGPFLSYLRPPKRRQTGGGSQARS
jgi:hypothetical protein